MTGSLLPPTTSSGRRGHRGRYDSTSPPPSEHVSNDPEMVGTRYGWVTVIGPEKRYDSQWANPYVLTRCNGCSSEQWQSLYGLRSGSSKGCQGCSQPKDPNARIRWTMRGARDRCVKPSDQSWDAYGGRGIRFEFSSLDEATEWVASNLGQPPAETSIDRIDNDGPYGPGNLRWASLSQQMSNQRRTRLREFHQEHWPYAEDTVRRKLREGKTRQQIIGEARLAVQERRKAWRTIEARLQSMTSSMPALAIGSRFPES